MDKAAALAYFLDHPDTSPATVRETFGFPVGSAIYSVRDTAKRRLEAQKRGGPTTSKGDQLRAYLTENPTAGTVDTAKRFNCDAGYVSTIKKEMGLARLYTAQKKPVKKPKQVKAATRPDDTFKNGTGWIEGLATALSAKPNGASHTDHTRHDVVQEAVWADYGLWMGREQLRGYLRGRAVEYLTKGDKLSVEEALRCVTKLSELTD